MIEGKFYCFQLSCSIYENEERYINTIHWANVNALRHLIKSTKIGMVECVNSVIMLNNLSIF